jgi:hypothetical protein
VLDSWGLFDPVHIQYKYKLHIFSHLQKNIKWFGPPILFSTETFEAWNSIFWMCSILSNHHSPSCYIAETLTRMEILKHIASGGWWKASDGSPVSAGAGIIEHFQNHNICCCLDLNMEPPHQPSMSKSPSFIKMY